MQQLINRYFKNTFLILVWVCASCGKKSSSLPLASNEYNSTPTTDLEIVTGANQIPEVISYLKNKKVAIVGNQTSVVKNQENYIHLVDTLLSHQIAIEKVFAPEHGFRGKADAGEVVKNGIDTKTGIPIISLYGKNKKPSAQVLEGLDIVIFDIQDVGARFYTYISSLHYVMEACAENNLTLLVLDRPNPNGNYVDGPVLEPEFKSFVGMHPIPIVHGMTIAEYAQMINGEKWLKNGVQCTLQIVKMKHYHHQKSYSLPIKPSPNLPNDQAINLYPSLCLFEGTNFSVGRGTNFQFQVYGAPSYASAEFAFTPQPNEGAKYPKHENKLCYGKDLRKLEKLQQLDFSFLIDAYQNTTDKEHFFNNFFVKLAGTQKLQAQIENGLPFSEIKKSWQPQLDAFKEIRKSYLIYP